MNRDIRRIIDADLNRVTEGLRVIEDIYRYCRDDAAMQQRLKSMRHLIASEIPYKSLIASRDAMGDVGFSSQGFLEEKRSSLKDILRSNMKRVQEGLRVLEEVMKLDSPAASRIMKDLRYECYQLEREMELMDRKTLPRGLYLILSDQAKDYEKITRSAVSEGIAAVQLRFQGNDSMSFLKAARTVREITEGSGTRFIVGSRLDIALLSGADGVHLAKLDITPKEARSLAGDQIMIGLSTYTLDQVEQALLEPVDYITFGPVFPPLSKESTEPVIGVDALRAATSRSKLPVVAVGGVTRERLEDLAGSSCRNVACMGAIIAAQDPAQEMRAIHSRTGEIL